ncbi:MAG: chorismate mutase [Acholeplasmatales bacterium]|nr:chorismate mutase [Acholeplasmatales bacterium]
MKNKLEESRDIINEIDDEMISLFVKRMAAVSMVAEYKYENGLPVLDSSREDDIKFNNVEKLCNKSIEKYYLTFFEGVLKSSKDYQKDLLEKFEKKTGNK